MGFGKVRAITQWQFAAQDGGLWLSAEKNGSQRAKTGGSAAAPAPRCARR
jgi:hypothetical protein